MAADIRLNGAHIEHPGYAERRNGATSQVSLGVSIGKSPTNRRIPLDEKQIVKLIHQLSGHLITLQSRDS